MTFFFVVECIDQNKNQIKLYISRHSQHWLNLSCKIKLLFSAGPLMVFLFCISWDIKNGFLTVPMKTLFIFCLLAEWAISTIMKVIQKAASCPMNGFLKTVKVDNFLLIFFITDGRGFHTPVHGAVGAFKLYFDSTSGFWNLFQSIGFELKKTSA